jgi:MYXO-CTERM domain-containing protein
MKPENERPSWSSSRRIAAALLLGLASVVLARPVSALLPGGCVALGTALVEHSCFHSTFGPFRSVLATPGSEARAETPSVDPVHTEHRVGLPASTGPNVVTYEPERSGAWSVFLGSDVGLAVLDAAGNALPVILTQRGNTGCDALSVAHVFELVEKQRYRLVLGPAAENSVVVVIEYTDDFLAESGPDRDGDGYGDATGTKVTNCTPEPGFAPNATDCNDDDAAIHPGAVERCDGVDQNCNGSADDAGLTCRAGAGSCAAVGAYVCDAVDSEPRCGAELGTPTPETCNQLDDDCNGAIDDAAALCTDQATPLCVREGMTAFCGCSIDLDCGGTTSGARCDAELRRCVSGCSTTPGRNGCPEGSRCVVAPGHSEGECELDPGSGGGAGGEASSGGAGVSSEGGETSSSGAAGAAGAAETAGAPPVQSEGGAGGEQSEPEVIVRTVRSCNCRVPGGAEGGRPGSLGVMLVLAAVVIRRRRFRRRAAALTAALVLGASACGGKVLTSGDRDDPPRSGGAAGHSLGASGGSGARAGASGSSAGAVTGAGGAAGAEPNCNAVSPVPVEHACSHATKGTLENAVASPDPASAPAVDVIHQTYAVELPSSGAAAGLVSYVASRDGEHLILTDRPVPVAVSDGTGRVLPSILSGPVSGCTRLPYGYAVALSIGQRYTVALGPSSDAPVILFMEHLGTFGEDAWSVRCGETN